MSAIAETARVGIILADFANSDSAGKYNVIGGGWQITGVNPSTGMTVPMAVLVSIDVAPTSYNESYSLELTLYDSGGSVVSAPGPMGQATALRVSQIVKAEAPNVPGLQLPEKVLWAHAQVVANFPGGLPLKAGETYTWTAKLDNDGSRTWSCTFHVAGAPPSPVIG